MQADRKVKIGIVGGAGYTGGELLRLLLNHPAAELAFIHSRSHAGKPGWAIHTDLLGDTDLQFTDKMHDEVELVFLCVAHGESKKIVDELPEYVRIIDLSSDFRTTPHAQRDFVYGLPELNREKISAAKNIANPGCFATAIQLALLPLAQAQLLDSQIHVSCTTGSTGAGQSLSESTHFSWRHNNLSVYKPFTHQHLDEINQSLAQAQTNFKNNVVMLPQRGAFTRGILACANLTIQEDVDTLINLYKNYYASHPFVHVSDHNIDLKQVVNTNKCLLYLEKNNDQLMIVSIIDNLLKGASGQAVQNMNILYGLDEAIGLKLKATAF